MDAWFEDFAEAFPLLAPLRAAARCAAGGWPPRVRLQEAVDAAGLRNAAGLPLRLAAPAADGLSYEDRLYERGELEFREGDWHDLFNLLVWLTYPRAKAALNARHRAARSTAAVAGGRGPVRDALTLFDESGVVVLSADAELLELLRGFRWKELFWTRRARVLAGLQLFPFGHALCGKLLRPYKGVTGHGLLFTVEPEFADRPLPEQLRAIDGRVAALLADPQSLSDTRALAPVPLLGMPGWCPDNGEAAYYDDAAQFRPGRRRDLRALQP